MINLKLIDTSITKGISTKYFAQYKTKEESKYNNWKDSFYKVFFENYEELSKCDWNFIFD